MSRVDAGRLALHVATYLHPPRFADALEILWEQRLLVLLIRQGTGLQTAALNLLAEALATVGDLGEDAGACYHVNDSGVVADMDWKPPSTGCGYLVLLDDAPGEGRPGGSNLSTDAIDEHWLDGKADQLEGSAELHGRGDGAPRGTLVEAAARSGHVLTTLGDVDPLRSSNACPGAQPDARGSRRRCTAAWTTRALALMKEVPSRVSRSGSRRPYGTTVT